jgi:hypothetical protein
LIAGLNKFYRPLSNREYWHEWGLKDTENAIAVSGMPEQVIKWIWEPVRDKKKFAVEFDKPKIRRM